MNSYKCDFIKISSPIVWTFTLDIGNIRLACNESEYSGLKSLVVKDNQSSESRLSNGQLISECLFDFLNFAKKPPKNLTNFCPRI